MKISDEIRNWCDICSGDFIDKDDCDELRGLADRIDSEMVELPKDAEGVPIHVGDTVYGSASGRQTQVTAMRLEQAWTITTTCGFAKDTSIFTHTRPDSWERIADELETAKGWCDQDGEHNSIVSSVSTKTLGGWADRIRKLAKKEGEHGND